ncbi:MAG: NADH-quinone oxidoreductase subunit C, partial [Rhodobacteraceae bacterium]|nr:NADH-quinone oxidoreductase subunit C [Paracoccaceae bacterium]
MSLEELSAAINAARPADLLDQTIAFGELTVTVKLASLVDFIGWLRLDPGCKFSTLVDITAVDHPERPERFDIVYHFLSMYKNARIR